MRRVYFWVLRTGTFVGHEPSRRQQWQKAHIGDAQGSSKPGGVRCGLGCRALGGKEKRDTLSDNVVVHHDPKSKSTAVTAGCLAKQRLTRRYWSPLAPLLNPHPPPLPTYASNITEEHRITLVMLTRSPPSTLCYHGSSAFARSPVDGCLGAPPWPNALVPREGWKNASKKKHAEHGSRRTTGKGRFQC